MFGSPRFDDLKAIGTAPNFQGLKHPLVHKPLTQLDFMIMYWALRRNSKHLEDHYWWGKEAASITHQQAKSYCQLREPNVSGDQRETYIFMVGDVFVGEGSLAPIGGKPDHVQVALWVDARWQGKGIGSKITETLMSIAFEKHKYLCVFYRHDSYNRASGAIPQKLGFEFHCFQEPEEQSCPSDSLCWNCWCIDVLSYRNKFTEMLEV